MDNVIVDIAGHGELVAEAQLEFGKSEIDAGNVDEAIKRFIKSLHVYEDISDAEGICTAHAELVAAYRVRN